MWAYRVKFKNRVANFGDADRCIFRPVYSLDRALSARTTSANIRRPARATANAFERPHFARGA